MSTSQAALDPIRLRQDFPILSVEPHPGTPLVYLDNAASTQRPRQVIDRLCALDQTSYANVHRGIHALSERCTDLYEQARETVRGFLNAASAEEIVFTRGCTQSINLVARAWGDENLGPGDEILVTLLEHHSNLVPWFQLARRRGAVVRFLPIDETGCLALEALDELLTPRTRLVAVTAVSNVLGTVVPLPQVVRAARRVDARVLIDAAQSVPHQPTDVQALGADFLTFSGHKMLGPTGIGVLWARRELLETMPPYEGGGSMISGVTTEGFEPADPPARFEAGTPPIAGAIGLAAAIEYLQQIGLEAVAQHEHALTVRAHELLESIDGVHLLGPSPEHKAGIVSFTVDRVHAHDVAQVLDQHGVAVRAGHHCAMPLHEHLNVPATTRASFYLYNTPADIDRLAEALHDVRQKFLSRAPRRRSRPENR